MYLNGTYNRFRVGKHLSDLFPIRNGLKQGDALSPLLLNFAVDYVIRMVQVNRNGLKGNGTYQLLVYAYDVNISGESVQTIKKNTEALVVANKEIRREVYADKIKYMVMSRGQIARRSHTIKFDNSSFESVEEFRYLGKTLTNQNSIQEEIKNRLQSGNACFHSMQNRLSSNLLLKNIKIMIYRTIILPVFLYGSETWSLTWREELRLTDFESRVLRRIFGPERDEVTGELRKLNAEELNCLYCSPNIIMVINREE